jgi:hypothetical protein
MLRRQFTCLKDYRRCGKYTGMDNSGNSSCSGGAGKNEMMEWIVRTRQPHLRYCLTSPPARPNGIDLPPATISCKSLAFGNTGKLRASGFLNVLPIRNALSTTMWRIAHQQTAGQSRHNRALHLQLIAK